MREKVTVQCARITVNLASQFVVNPGNSRDPLPRR